MIRNPAVADQFYPGNPSVLSREVGGYLNREADKTQALAVIAPHAGYMFSGKVAGMAFSRVEIPGRIILLGVNHRGIGAPVAVMAEGAWEMPNGRIEMDRETARAVMKHSKLVKEDETAHRLEHSLEVQVPFLQALRSDFLLTPIALSFLSYEDCEELGKAVAAAVLEAGEPVLIVASTDMTHYESQTSAKRKDEMAIDRIEALDPEGLHRTVVQNRISMCGVIPVAVTLVACKALGASRCELIAYATSGDVTRDYDQVVGYAGFVVV